LGFSDCAELHITCSLKDLMLIFISIDL